MTVRFHESLTQLLVPLDQVTPYPGNPRSGDVDAIVESIRFNGMYQPVVAQRSTGHVLAGNHRHAALVALGETRIPVVWVDVDDDAAARIALTDNRTSDVAGYDETALLELLELVNAADAGLAGTGYDPGALDDLRALLSVAPDLDELATELGEATEEDTWVALSFKAPRDVVAAWDAELEASGLRPGKLLARLLGVAGELDDELAA